MDYIAHKVHLSCIKALSGKGIINSSPIKHLNRRPEQTQQARTLRQTMGEAERLLGDNLRRKQTAFQSRRQFLLEPYILNFYCTHSPPLQPQGTETKANPSHREPFVSEIKQSTQFNPFPVPPAFRENLRRGSRIKNPCRLNGKKPCESSQGFLEVW